MGIYYQPPNPNVGAQQPLAPEVLIPPESGPTPQAPPINGGAIIPVAVLIAWLPPPYPPYQGNQQPYAQEVLDPPISGPTPQNPPITGGAQVPLAVEVSWIPPPPQPPVAINLDPPIAGPTPQNPPVSGGARVPGAVLIAWLPPDPASQRSPYLPPLPALAPPPVSGPVSVPYAVRSWWDLPAPAPIVARNLNPPISGVAPTNPPFMGGAKAPAAVHLWWIPPPPQPPVGWSATQIFLPKQVIRFNPRFLSLPATRLHYSTPQPRPLVSYSFRRTTVTKPQGPATMNNRGNDFSPVDPTETVTDTWDFAPWLKTGVTITSIVGTQCTLLSGTDASPGSRLIAGPVVTASPTTGVASQAVMQQVSTMQPGCCYDLSCTVDTSDNQVFTLYAYQRCGAQT